MAVERVKTGIKGLDDLIEGGIPKGYLVLVSGQAGSGKTSFGLQFACSNAKAGNNALFVSLEEEIENVKNEAAGIGLDVNQKNLFFEQTNPYDFKKFMDYLDRTISKTKAKVLVLDSLSSLIFFAPNYTAQYMEDLFTKEVPVDGEAATKIALYDLIRLLRKKGVTAMLIGDIPKDSPWYSRDTISEFMCDGVILLYSVEGEDAYRNLRVAKMRLTKNKSGIYSFQIGKNGVTVKSSE